ncbi:hypothetical protein [Tautonia plasticadhaerens]|nr:hypothetical protein [Tautonia plasticadhaerens]
MSFDFTNWRQKSKELADQAVEAVRGQTAGVTDQAVRGAVDQALRVLSIAVEQVKAKEPAPPDVSIGVGMSLGLFYLEMHVQVPKDGEPSDLAAALKRSAGDVSDPGEGPETGPSPGGGGQDDVVP